VTVSVPTIIYEVAVDIVSESISTVTVWRVVAIVEIFVSVDAVLVFVWVLSVKEMV
jgi:hypothetical protein